MPRSHTVKQGESLYIIAAAHQIADWKKIWNDDANAELRGKRKSPHILFPGDTVVIPDPAPDSGLAAKLDGRLELTRRR
jgi:hypothetical protein